MTDITPISRSNVAALSTYEKSSAATSKANGTPRPADRAEFSDSARLLSLLREVPDVREDLVARVRGEIEAGTYETPDKIDALLDGLAEDLA